MNKIAAELVKIAKELVGGAPFTTATARRDVAERLTRAGISFRSLSAKTTSFEGFGYGSAIFVTIVGAILPIRFKEKLFSDIPKPSLGGYMVSLRDCKIQNEDGTVFTPMM